MDGPYASVNVKNATKFNQPPSNRTLHSFAENRYVPKLLPPIRKKKHVRTKVLEMRYALIKAYLVDI